MKRYNDNFKVIVHHQIEGRVGKHKHWKTTNKTITTITPEQFEKSFIVEKWANEKRVYGYSYIGYVPLDTIVTRDETYRSVREFEIVRI